MVKSLFGCVRSSSMSSTPRERTIPRGKRLLKMVMVIQNFVEHTKDQVSKFVEETKDQVSYLFNEYRIMKRIFGSSSISPTPREVTFPRPEKLHKLVMMMPELDEANKDEVLEILNEFPVRPEVRLNLNQKTVTVVGYVHAFDVEDSLREVWRVATVFYNILEEEEDENNVEVVM